MEPEEELEEEQEEEQVPPLGESISSLVFPSLPAMADEENKEKEEEEEEEEEEALRGSEGTSPDTLGDRSPDGQVGKLKILNSCSQTSNVLTLQSWLTSLRLLSPLSGRRQAHQ